ATRDWGVTLFARASCSCSQSQAESATVAREILPSTRFDLRMRHSSAADQFALDLVDRQNAVKFRRSRRFNASLPVTAFQLAHYLLQRQAARTQQHQQMEQQVRGFADDLVIGFADAGERQFHAFFADLLCDTGDAFLEQARRVARFRSILGALCDHGFELREKCNRFGAAAWLITE